MISGFGKQSITLGSAPGCDIRLGGPGVAPEHARIVRQADSSLLFVCMGTGPTLANGSPIPPGATLPFDFRTQFTLGQAVVPITHPSITLMLMHPGNLAPVAGQVVFGRDASQAHVVIQNPAVSGRHLMVQLSPLVLTDLGSTSGTWVGQNRLPPHQPVPLDPSTVIAIGPVPVPLQLIQQLAMEIGAIAPDTQAAPLGTGLVAAALQPRTPAHGPAHPAGPTPGGNHGYGPPPGQPQMGSPHPYGPPPVPQGHHGPQPAPGYAPSGGPQPGVAPMAGPIAPVAPEPGALGPRKKHKTVVGQVAMAGAEKPFRVIGRTPDNDIVLNHPQVSSKHAVLHVAAGQLFLEDRGSSNGTYVRGARIPPGQKVPVSPGEKVFIGPMPLMLQMDAQEVQMVVEDYQAQWAGRPLYEIEAWDLLVQVPDRDRKGELKTLLDHVSFKALPGDLIALMGPSGAGKTTLLLTLNGYMPPSAGQVRINGEDFYSIYDMMRGSIGYVPQDDIVHPELTVWQAVRYSAKFRLPPDFSSEEIDRRVEETLLALGLENVKHLPIGRPEKKTLSGGQRKRVNIAMELVTDPIIMFLDEPTSGLAADDTTALVSLLAELARKTGKTIICTIHQPAKDEFEKFNLALILGQGGVPLYYGPTKEAYTFFGSFLPRIGKRNDVDNPRDMFEMLNQRERAIFEAMRAQNPNVPRFEARRQAAREWKSEFYEQPNPIFQKMYSGPRSVGTGAHHQGVPRSRPRTTGQFWLLLSRYARIKWGDAGGLWIMLLQAPVIGLLLAVVFGGQKEAIPYWCLGALQDLAQKFNQLDSTSKILESMHATADNSAAMFFLVVAAVWFGTSNAAREIVSEHAIYKRERMVNLRLFNYVFSKFTLLSFFCVVQCTILLGIVFFALGFNGGPRAFLIELTVMTITAMDSVALGLLVSTMVSTSEAAASLTPIALIPQVVLGGLMVPMTTNPILRFPMYLVPARWGFQGCVAEERQAILRDSAWIVDLGKSDLTSSENFVEAGKFMCAEAQIASDSLNGAWGFTNYDQLLLAPGVLGFMMFVTLIFILIILKRRDSI